MPQTETKTGANDNVYKKKLLILEHVGVIIRKIEEWANGRFFKWERTVVPNSLDDILSDANLPIGSVFHVSGSFTTDDRFLPPTGRKYLAGTNIVVVRNNNQRYFDVLGGVEDKSSEGYYQSAGIINRANFERALNDTENPIGSVFIVVDDFVADPSFFPQSLEGSVYPAGTSIVLIEPEEGERRWMILGGGQKMAPISDSEVNNALTSVLNS